MILLLACGPRFDHKDNCNYKNKNPRNPNYNLDVNDAGLLLLAYNYTKS